jgi:hypothetical protein
LLGRLAASARIRTPLDASNTKELEIDATTMATDLKLVQPSSCVDVTFAVGAGVQGAEIRLVDAATDVDLAIARGTYSAIAEACALDRPMPLRLRIEMRVGAGGGSALLATIARSFRSAHR